MQLYMEHVSDLLDPLYEEKAEQRLFDEAFCARGMKDEGMPHSLPIREDKKRGVFVEGLTKLKVNSAKEVLDAIRGAAQCVFVLRAPVLSFFIYFSIPLSYTHAS